jgi:hypothetical protein
VVGDQPPGIGDVAHERSPVEEAGERRAQRLRCSHHVDRIPRTRGQRGPDGCRRARGGARDVTDQQPGPAGVVALEQGDRGRRVVE